MGPWSSSSFMQSCFSCLSKVYHGIWKTQHASIEFLSSLGFPVQNRLSCCSSMVLSNILICLQAMFCLTEKTHFPFVLRLIQCMITSRRYKSTIRTFEFPPWDSLNVLELIDAISLPYIRRLDPRSCWLCVLVLKHCIFKGFSLRNTNANKIICQGRIWVTQPDVQDVLD